MPTIYDYYLANPPSRSTTGLDARPFQNSFWVGYDGGPMMGEPNSNARLAWQAGRDRAKAIAEHERRHAAAKAKIKERYGLDWKD